jgi:hypothetical protein
MGQVLHRSATTTEAVRRAIQHSQESLRALAKRYGVNPKTIAFTLVALRSQTIPTLRILPKACKWTPPTRTAQLQRPYSPRDCETPQR